MCLRKETFKHDVVSLDRDFVVSFPVGDAVRPESGFFSISKLELQIEVVKNNKHARRVLSLRKDANFLLVTILWGNVAVNVLLALLSGSVLTGIMAFLFSTIASHYGAKFRLAGAAGLKKYSYLSD